MVKYNPMVVTNQGQKYMLEASNTVDNTIFSKVVISDKVYTQSGLKDLTTIDNIKLTVNEPNVVAINSTTISTIASFNNKTLASPLTANTIGLYAVSNDDSTEFLYAVSTAKEAFTFKAYAEAEGVQSFNIRFNATLASQATGEDAGDDAASSAYVTIDMLNASEARANTYTDKALTDLHLGGANIIKNTENLGNFATATGASTTIKFNDDKSEAEISYAGSTTGNGGLTILSADFDTRSVLPQVGDMVTMSFEAKGDGKYELSQKFADKWYKTKSEMATANFKRYELTFQWQADFTQLSFLAHPKANSSMTIRHPKLELSPKATDWMSLPKDGTSNFIHVAYADDAQGLNFSLTDTDRSYLGVYVGEDAEASTAPTLYTWIKVRGADGLSGVDGEDGQDGKTSYIHIAYANSQDGVLDFSTTDSADKIYMGQYQDFKAEPSTDPGAYQWTKIKGEDGKTPIKGTDYFDGKDGQDGKSSYLWIRYAEDEQGSGLTTDPTNAKYVGYATTTTNNAPTNAGAYTWQLVVGSDGVPGEKGADGKTSYLHIKYSDDNGATFTANNGEDAGAYIGQYTDFTKADSTNVDDYNWSQLKGDKGDQGEIGLQGPQGDQGIPGEIGPDGLPSYTHLAYANSADGVTDFSLSDAARDYVGMYTDSNIIDSENPADYLWSLIKGADGANGTPGKPGADGKTSYFHVAYADSADGTEGFSTTDSLHKPYIGQYTDYTEADSTDPAKYTWTLIKGDKGEKGDQGVQGLQGPKGDKGIQGPIGPDGKSSYAHVAYANSADGTLDFSVSDSDRKYMGVYVDLAVDDSTTPSDYAWSLIKGADGANGTPGKAGADGKTPYLHIAYATSADGSSGFSTTDSQGKIYIGQYTDYTEADSNAASSYAWTQIKGDKGDQGPKGDTGKDGIPGKDGVGIKNTVIAYQLSASGTTAPTGTWSASVPTLTKGQYLWTRTTLTYTDGSVEPVYSVAYVAKDGNNGTDGIAGKDGVGIKSTVVEYVGSTSGITKPTSGWSTTIPSVPGGQYLWTRTTWTYTDNTTEQGFIPTLMGPKGDKGDPGNQGIPGKAGADGKTPYTHWAYSWSPDGTDRFTTSYPNENLYLNSSFETNAILAVTINTGRWSQSSDVAYSGTYSLKVTATNSGDHGVSIPVRKPLPNTSYTFSGYLYSDLDKVVQLSGYSGGWTSLGRQNVSLKAKTWTFFTYTLTATTSIDNVILAFFMNADTTAFYIDKVKIEIGETATPWTPAPSEDFDTAYPTYSGTYTDYTATDSEKPADYTWTRILGEAGKDGEDGVPGKDGLGIKESIITYQLGTSGTTAPTGTWTATIPTLVKGQYLWTKTTLTYTDNSSEPTYSVSYVAKDGNNGSDGIPGKDGVGIKSTAVTYAVSTSGTTVPTTGWETTPPALSDGKYLWTRTVFTYTDNTTEPTYAVAKSGSTGPQGPKGDPGKDGVAGKDGLGIKSTTITYQLGTSGTSAPTGTWSSTVPSLVKGQYLWTKTMLTYTDSSTETLYSVSYVAKDGNSGKDGVAGKDGVGIKSTTVTYQVSSSGTTIPTGAWSSSPPAISAGQYMWTRTVWTYTDGSTEPGYSVAMSGKNGAQGPKGDKGDTGTPGKAGADGKTPYNHVAWSWSADGSDRFSTSYPGTNLLQNTSNFIDTKYWYNNDGTTLTVKNGVLDVYKDTLSSYRGLSQTIPLTKDMLGMPISASAVVKRESDSTVEDIHLLVHWLSDEGKILSQDSFYNGATVLSNEYSELTWTGTIPADTTATKMRVIFLQASTTAPIFHVMFKSFKYAIEEKPSIYTPNPLEDSDAAYPTYRGEYTDYTEADSTDYKKYTWTRVRGDKGESLNTIKVTSAAFQPSPVPTPGVWISGEEVAGPVQSSTNYNGWGRGHNLVVLNKDTFKVESVKNYDDYTTSTLADTLASDINALKDKIVIVLAMDDSTMTANLRAALTACGGNPDISTYKSSRSAHILIGMSKDASGKSVLQPRQGHEIFDSSASAVRTLYASQGGDGLAVNGQNGSTSYLHTAYADSEDGTLHFSTDYTEKNILLDTDVPTLTKVNGPADRYFSDGQVDYYGAKIVAVTDGVNGSKYASQFTKPNDGLSGKQTALCWYSNRSTGLKEGHTYKVSAYFRIVDGKGTRARFQIGSGPYDNKTSDFSSNQWTKVEETYTISTALHGGSPRVYIGISSPASSYGTLQMTYPEVTEVSPKYMGTYSDFNEVDSTDPKKYTWVKIQGQSERTHIAWAWSPDGSDRFLTSYPKENILTNTTDFSGQAKDHVEILSSNDYNGHKVIHGSTTTALAGNIDTIRISTKQNMTGTQYTASFTAWSSANGTKIGNYFFNPNTTTKSENSQGVTDTIGDGLSQITLTTTPTRYWVRWTQTSTDKPKTIILGRIVAGTTGDVYLTEPTLVEGSEPSSYAPAPSEGKDNAYPSYKGEYRDFLDAQSTNYKDYKWVRVLGETGSEGPAGKDSHTHIAYANSADGKTDFSLADSNRDYMGMYWDYEDAASTDPSKYKWTKTKGRDGTQGIPGPTGPNGKDSQFHQAWADSSDGKTGFSTTISLGKKYLGTYTDYVAADSTDPTKYKWTELVGAIEIGGRNLIVRTGELSNTMINPDGAVASFEGSALMINPITVTANESLVFNRYGENTGGDNYFRFGFYDDDDAVILRQAKSDKSFVVQVPAGATKLKISYPANTNVKAERGNKPTDWSPAPEDIDMAIDDANNHTDDAINDVNNGIDNIYDVLGNKADADEFKDLQDQAQALQDSYEAFVSDGGQYETDLTNLENRATALYESLGDKLLQLSFINTWMKVGEEGLLIGSEDSSVKMLLGNDQLSFTDGGQTVAYFTAQSFYINKGAVVTSLQVNMHKLSRIDDNHTAFVYTG